MPDPIFLGALAKFGKEALSDAVKESLKAWLTDAVRVRRAIQKTASIFSTKLSGTENALALWIQTDAFRASMEDLISGRILPDRIASVDEFLTTTGIGFSAADHAVVREMLASFYEVIRADLVSSREGLVLVDQRLGEALRQMRDLRADLAAVGGTQAGTQRISIELLNAVALKQGWGVGLQFGTELNVNTDLPPAVRNLATRAKTVSSVRDILDSAVWYGMYGGSGSGKTQLAILIASTFSGRKVWVRLGGPESAAVLVLESALARLSLRAPGQSTVQWCEAVCRGLGSASAIILDDLPRTIGDGAFDEYLTFLCAACAQFGVRLITTASTPIANSTRDAVGTYLREDSVPEFSDDDIRDLFRAYDPPKSFLSSRWFAFVMQTAKRHPVLLVEAARYLRDRGWVTDDRSFDDLARGAFASALDLPTLERLKQTVPKDETRDFLYRLKIIGWSFGVEEVQRVSGVAPSIAFPLEELAAVMGLWVQQAGNSEYVLSPLLARLSDHNLPSKLQRAIHLELANAILEKKRLGPLHASQAINHFVAGGDTNNAAMVLLVALNGMLGMTGVGDPFLLTGVWAGMPLPTEIALQKRIYIRTLQVVLRRQLGRNTEFELADLERLVDEGASDLECQLLIAGAGAILVTHLGDKEPNLGIQFLRRSIKAARLVDMPPSTNPELDFHSGLFTLLWMTAAWIQTDLQYQEWFSAVRDLTPEEALRWAALPFAAQASQTVCGGLWTRTADLPDDRRNWDQVLGQLRELRTWADSANVLSLAAAAISSEVIVLAEYQNKLQEANTLAKRAVPRFEGMPQSKFAIADTIARQHYYFGKCTDAIAWFETAFTVEGSIKPGTLVNAFTLAGIAASSVDVQLANRYLERGTSTAASPRVRIRPRIIVKSELGILLWNGGQHRQAFDIWSSAAQEIIAARNDTPEWQSLFRVFGNCTGYFISNEHNFAIDTTQMAVPFSGIFLRQIKDIQALANPEEDWLLPAQMTLLAESVGAYEHAIEWAERTTIGNGAFWIGAEALLAGALAARDLREHRFAEVIRAAADLGDLDETFEGFNNLDEEIRGRRTSGFSARLNLLALTVELVRLTLRDRSSANSFARSAEALAQGFASSRGGSRLWSGMADVFGAIVTNTTSWRDLWEKSVAERELGNSALQIAYGIEAIAVAGPREALQMQLQIIPWLERLFSPTLYHFMIVEFVRDYWRWALDQYPMNFGLLARTRRTVVETKGDDDEAVVREILLAVTFSLALPLPSDVKSWLYGTTGTTAD
jgi:hypothetical protein